MLATCASFTPGMSGTRWLAPVARTTASGFSASTSAADAGVFSRTSTPAFFAWPASQVTIDAYSSRLGARATASTWPPTAAPASSKIV